jgi:hypothetical protein
MAHDLAHEDDLIPIQQRGQELIDRLKSSNDVPAPAPLSRAMPRIGVALGGGSARGLTHIPFIEAMDELGLKPSTIAGTSIGALIGSGWANGMTGKELREHALNVLGTMRTIAGRIWGQQIGNLGGIVRNGFNLQLDATRVVDAFPPTRSPTASRTWRSPSTWSRPISRAGTRWCSTAVSCGRRSPVQSPSPASSGQCTSPTTSWSMAASSTRCRSTRRRPIATSWWASTSMATRPTK